MARTIRKTHVPAYCPALFGIQLSEYRDVVVEVKKVIIMASIPIIVPAEVDVGIEPSDELDIAIPDIIADGVVDVVEVILIPLIPFMSILLIALIAVVEMGRSHRKSGDVAK